MSSYLPTILDILTLLAIMFAIYKYFRDPDINASTDIKLIKQNCEFKHKSIDEDIALIKNNHLAHIEKDIDMLSKNQIKILTILDERLPNKKII